MAPEENKKIQELAVATNGLSTEIRDLKTSLLSRWEQEEENLRRIRLGVIVAACVGVFASIAVAVLISIIGHYQIHDVRKTSEQALQTAIAQRVKVCRESNEQKSDAAAKTRAYFKPKIKLYESEHKFPDPVLDAILRGLADSQPILTNCTGIK